MMIGVDSDGSGYIHVATRFSSWSGVLKLEHQGGYVTLPGGTWGTATTGNVGIGTAAPAISGTGKLHMAADTFRLDTARTPATAAAAGNAGEYSWDASYLYLCIADATWRRVAHNTW